MKIILRPDDGMHDISNCLAVKSAIAIAVHVMC